MKKVLFLVGPHASGKTYSSREYIAKNKNIGMIDTGPIMRRIHKEMDPDISMGDWVKKLEVQYGKNITSQLISNEIGKIMSNDDCDKFILIGFRTLEGIAFTIQHLNIEDFSILYVDATQELLYQNYLAREKKNISFEDFKNYLQNELNSGLTKLREMALNGEMIDYYYRFSNDDSFEEKIDSHLTNCEIKKLRKEPKNGK